MQEIEGECSPFLGVVVSSNPELKVVVSGWIWMSQVETLTAEAAWV